MRTILGTHLIFPLFFFSATGTPLHRSTGASTIYKWSLPLFFDPPSEVTGVSPLNTETCPLTPLPMQHLPGCVYLQNLDSSQVDSIESEFERALHSTTFNNAGVEDLKDEIITRIAKSFEMLLKSSSDSGLRDSNICLGTYDSPESFSGFEGVCQDLPLSPHKWSVFGFALSLGLDSPFLPVCTGFRRGYASFCIAVAKDCVGNPSLAFSFKPQLFRCQPFNTVLSLSTSGLSSLFVTLASEFVEHVTFGISFSNSFVQDFEMNTGSEFIKASIPGTIYSSGAFEMRPSDFFDGVPDFVRLQGEGGTVLSVDGKDAVERTVDWVKNNPLKVEKFVKMVGEWEDIDYRLFFDMENIRFDLLFSELDTEIGLPDIRNLALGKGLAYVSNAPLTSSVPLLPGMYINANGISGDDVREMLEALLTKMENSLGGLGWVPYYLNPGQILDIVDVGSLSFELALAMTGYKISMMLYSPLLDTWLGVERICCVIDFVVGDIDCGVETGIAKARLVPGVGVGW